MNKEELKARYEHYKWCVRIRVNKAIVWVRTNPEIVAVAVPIAVAGIKSATKVGAKMMQRANMEHAEREIRTRCYDPSEGHYWFLKRELSNQEWLLVNNRHQNGERLGDILAGMNVLK